MISFVFFDVGGVILKDFSGTNKWDFLYVELGVSIEKVEKFKELWKKYGREVNINRDVDSLIPILNSELHLSIPDGYSLLNGFVNRFEKNETIWPIIETVRRTCGIGLLTDMYPRLFSKISERALIPEGKWDLVIDSSLVGCKKPDVQIFELAQSRISAKKENVLFVENTLKHVEAAQKFGWQTFLYDPKNCIESSKQLLNYFETHKI